MIKFGFLSKAFLCLMLVGLVPGMCNAQDDELDVGELMEEAQSHIQAEEWQEAADLLKKVVKADDENSRAWMLLGYSLHGAGKLDEAIDAHEHAASFRMTAGLGNYNLCCAYSLKKENKKALKYLKKAFEAGFRQFDHMEGDSDLDNIREDEAYIELVKATKEKMRSGEEDKDEDKEGKDEDRDEEANEDPLADLDPEVGEKFQEAAQMIQNEEFEEAAEILKELVKKAPKNDLVWFQYGYALHASGELDEAIKAHIKTASFKKRMSPIAQYNLGCAYSLQKKIDKSFEALGKAVDMGYADIEQFESDDDLRNLRDDDRYDELIAKVEKKQEEMRKKFEEMRKKQSRPDF